MTASSVGFAVPHPLCAVPGCCCRYFLQRSTSRLLSESDALFVNTERTVLLSFRTLNVIRSVRSSHLLCVCLLLQNLVQSCVRGEGGDIGGHVLRETTSRGLCGLVCRSRIGNFPSLFCQGAACSLRGSLRCDFTCTHTFRSATRRGFTNVLSVISLLKP
jgi:hypothetical protein